MQVSPVKNQISRVLGESFSENDVLYLQDLFLTPGVHQIGVDNIIHIRKIIYNMLSALQYHQKAACLTLNNLALQPNITDIVKTLIMDDHLVNSDSLTLFFLDHFYFDFLWIEESQALLDSMWYEQFKQHLVDFNFNKSIPIVKVIFK